MKKEIWKPIFDGALLVSSLGRVQNSVTSLVYAPSASRGGYLRVNPAVKRKRRYLDVHVLVAQAFYGARPKGFDINHRDGVKTNNTARNLHYVSRRENVVHAYKNGLIRKGESRPSAKLSLEQVREIRKRQAEGPARLAAEFGVARSLIWAITRFKIWADQ